MEIRLYANVNIILKVVNYYSTYNNKLTHFFNLSKKFSIYYYFF